MGQAFQPADSWRYFAPTGLQSAIGILFHAKHIPRLGIRIILSAFICVRLWFHSLQGWGFICQLYPRRCRGLSYFAPTGLQSAIDVLFHAKHIPRLGIRIILSAFICVHLWFHSLYSLHRQVRAGISAIRPASDRKMPPEFDLRAKCEYTSNVSSVLLRKETLRGLVGGYSKFF